MLPPGPIVLASASPRRRELLERVGFELEVAPADVDESVRPGEAPLDYVRRVAADKARAVPRDGWVLAADTIVELDGEVLGKAADDDEARGMLRALRGRTHRVTTAFVIRGPRGADGLVTSEVDLAAFDDRELEAYVACGEWRGKAGAYAVQGIGGALVSAVRGSISNVIGLPLREVIDALAAVGAAAPQVHGREAGVIDIAARWQEVRAGVDAAARATGRDPSSVTVVAVSKLQPSSAVAAAAAAGVTDVGENYAQELAAKQLEVTAPLRWHFIGKLQRNKVKQVVGHAALIHAVDSLALAEEIAARARAAGIVQDILVAVNTGGEVQKTGADHQAMPALIDAISALDGIAVRGLMTMPPWPEQAEDSRAFFRTLRDLRDALATEARPLSVLSMGTSIDAIVAIEEGATLVRIGTAIFGERPSDG